MLPRSALLLTLLQVGVSLAVPISPSSSPRVLSVTEMQTLLLAQNQDEIVTEVENVGQNDTLPYLANSCTELPKNFQSGYYFIKNSTGIVNVEFCDLDKNLSTGNVGWMRVAHLDMTDHDQQCPDGLHETGDRRCTKASTAVDCSSVIFPTHGHEYSRVCGKIRAYQSSHPSAFRSYILRKPVTTLEDNYVDGISLTHGPAGGRQHIWTFAAAYSDQSMQCSCGSPPNPDLVPPFIGQDFFCETASRTGYEEKVFNDDPLWDGKGCGASVACCGYNNPPWFCKQLSQSTTEDIEMRLCMDLPPVFEEVRIDNVELYIQ